MRIIHFIIIIWVLSFFCEDVFASHGHTKHQHKRSHYVASHNYQRHSPVVYAPSSIIGESALANEINNLLQSTNSEVDVGVYVKSMKYGNSLYTKNVDHSFVPASVMKVLTAEAALLYMGPEYRFPTTMITDAKTINNGVLQGNLYILQSGDPTLTYYDLADLMVKLKSQQILAIAGNVYIDTTAYDEATYGPGWLVKDKKYCYAAPISASIINHNCISFQLTPARASGVPANIIVSPRYYYPNIRNNVITRSSGTRSCFLSLNTLPGSTLSLNGCMPKGRYAWGVSYVVTDIPEYNRLLFQNLFQRFGVRIYGHLLLGSAPSADLPIIATHQSKPLRSMINEMLKKSDNVIAGALFKKLGQLFTQQPGSWQNGSLAVTQILSQRTNLNPSGIRVVDGSGLSRDNRLTPAQMMQVLDYAFHHYGTSYEFISSLPISGIDGTLKYRMSNITRKVRAKTGSMKGVISLAGYAMNANKEPLAFVIMINGNGGGWQYKELEDKIATVLTRYRA